MTQERNKELITALNNCAVACNHCSMACLEEEQVSMLAKCVKLDMDCADICQLVVTFAARDSAHTVHLLKECAEICEACATECEKHDMSHCRECAAACRQCAKACIQAAA